MPPTVAADKPRLTALKAARHAAAGVDDRGVVVVARRIAEPSPRRARKRARDPPPELQTISINGFCELTGLSRMTVWRMLRRGDLESVTVGVKRLILLESWHQYIERSKGAQQT